MLEIKWLFPDVPALMMLRQRRNRAEQVMAALDVSLRV